MDHVHTVLQRLTRVRVTSSGSRATSWEAQCPAHDDRNPSLAVSLGSDGQVLLYCHAGCDAADVVRALGLEWADLYPEHLRKKPQDAGGHGTSPDTEATYRYRDEDGQVLFRVARLGPTSSGKKRFILQRPDGHGGWENGIRGIRRVLYRLPEVKKAVAAGVPILLVEGEKDVETALRLAAASPVRFEPTTSPMGAGKWLATYGQALAGAVVWIIPDHDEAGQAHARHVAASLQGLARSVHIVELPDLDEHGDLTDWVERGHGAEELIEVISRVAGGSDLARSGAETNDAGDTAPGRSDDVPDDRTASITELTLQGASGSRELKPRGPANREPVLGSNGATAGLQVSPGRPRTDAAAHPRTRIRARRCYRQADVLRRLLTDHGVAPFRDPHGTLYVEVPRARGNDTASAQTYRLDDHAFALYLAGLFYQETGHLASRRAITTVTWWLASEARYGSEVRLVFVRAALLEASVFLDLGSDALPVAQVSSAGWTLAASAPATFLRPAGMAPLPAPVRGGSLELLRECLHLAPGEDWTITRAWVLASLLPFGDVPPLLIGGAGALRTSTLAMLLAYLLDPWHRLPPEAAARARRPASDPGRFVQLVDLSAGLADHLAFLEATGEGLAGETGPRVVVTGSSGAAMPDPLRRRCLEVTPRWAVSEVAGSPVRGHPGSFFASVHGSILGAVLDAAVEAYRGYNRVDVPLAYRGTAWEPFVRWVSAAEKAIGGPAPHLVEVLRRARRRRSWRGLLHPPFASRGR